MKSVKTLPAILSLSVLMFIYAGCSKSSSYGGNNTTPITANTIKIQSMAFSPVSFTVKMGTVIKWQNDDNTTHSATSNDGTSFDLTIPANGSVSFTCNTVGTFAYHCKFHSGMTATLIVTL